MERFSDREEKVAIAAEDVFVRYGFARTTMGDIARAAGISRPALYILFPDKEAIFSRVIEMMDARSLAKIQQAVDRIESVDGKLLHACTVWGLHGVGWLQPILTPQTFLISGFRRFGRSTSGFNSFWFGFWKSTSRTGSSLFHGLTLRRRSPMAFAAFAMRRRTSIT